MRSVWIRVYVSPSARRSPTTSASVTAAPDVRGEDGLEAGGQPYLAVLIPHNQGQVLRAEPGAGAPDDQTVDGVSVADFHPAAAPRGVRGGATLGHHSFEALLPERFVPVLCHIPVVGRRYGLERRADLREQFQGPIAGSGCCTRSQQAYEAGCRAASSAPREAKSVFTRTGGTH